MTRKLVNLTDLFGGNENDVVDQSNAITSEIPIGKLVAAKIHPFKPYNEERLSQLVDSIVENGIIQPIIVRPKENGFYEILSGHNRVNAAKRAGLITVPAVIKDVDDNDATLIVTETNLKQREKLFPSEKAFAYKMQLEAKKNKQKNSQELNNVKGLESFVQVARKDSFAELANENDVSQDEIKRHIRLTFLIRDLLDLVDEEKIPFMAGVDLSFLKEDGQLMVIDHLNLHNCKIDLNKSKRLKELSQSNNLDEDKIYKVLMGEEKPPKPKSIKLKPKLITKFFSPEQKAKEIEEIIEEALTHYFNRLDSKE